MIGLELQQLLICVHFADCVFELNFPFLLWIILFITVILSEPPRWMVFLAYTKGYDDKDENTSCIHQHKPLRSNTLILYS